MSVRVTVELEVTGTDDAEAIRDLLHARDRYVWPEFGDPIWHAMVGAGLVDVDVETESVECESDA